MMTMGDLSRYQLGLMGIYIVLLFLYAFMHLVVGLSRRELRGLPFLLPELFVLYIGFQLICKDQANRPVFSRMMTIFDRIPVPAMLVILVVFTIAEMVQSEENWRWVHSHITARSMKDAVDDLPAGICCFDQNGRVMLRNRSMGRISRALTGEALLNGQTFREAILEEGELVGSRVVLEMEDGEVFAVFEEISEYLGEPVTILTAMNISEEYYKMQSLTEQRQAVQALNEQLTVYGREIVSNISAKELLSAKVKIHDELGLNLLASKRYILAGGTPEDLETIKEGLQQNIRYLRREATETRSDEYQIIMETAENLHVNILVSGLLPEEEPVKHILATGIHECLTNTIRHARGNELYVDLTEDGERLVAVFTNNGEPPKEEIREKGGLVSLRRLVEQNGGQMTLRSKDKFELTLTFPKEVVK